ncbi:MAG: polymer-forming cytoskeletal protein [Lachnospiraceae bacterium]|nr:polymer-forming cytoskeletal protein [Lachnospiraceae bacterium]
MAKKSNFKRALNELLGGDAGSASEAAVSEEVSPEEEIQEEVSQETTKEDFSWEYSRREFVEESTEEERMEERDELDKDMILQMPQATLKREEAVIPMDMVITGNVTTQSNMKIYGNIIGDVECAGDILLRGNIEGNVDVGNLSMQGGSLSGDVAVQQNASLEEGSVLRGNLSAQNVYTNAHSEGRMTVAGLLQLASKASVEGDITSAEMEMTAGAKVKGMVSINGR